MNSGSITSAFIAAQASQLQMAAAAKMLRMNVQQGAEIAKLLEAAQQNFKQLAEAAVGLGRNVDISV